MKLFSLILSVVVFFGSLYFFILKVGDVDSLNDWIYISLLVTLMAICVVGVIVNWEFFRKKKNNNLILFVTNSYSRKKKKK
jgi:membrane protein DedA with SNARE-associated domain